MEKKGIWCVRMRGCPLPSTTHASGSTDQAPRSPKCIISKLYLSLLAITST